MPMIVFAKHQKPTPGSADCLTDVSTGLACSYVGIETLIHSCYCMPLRESTAGELVISPMIMGKEREGSWLGNCFECHCRSAPTSATFHARPPYPLAEWLGANMVARCTDTIPLAFHLRSSGATFYRRIACICAVVTALQKLP
jgi:hypothetical protein